VKKYLLVSSTLLALLMLPNMAIAEEDRTKRPTVTQLFNVKTVKVKMHKSAKTRTYYGYIKAEDSMTVDISPRFGGYVEKLYADTRYTKVKKDEALALVYSPEVLQAKEDYLNSINFNARRSSPGMLKSARIKLELLGLPEKEIASVRNRRKSSQLTNIVSPVSGWVFEKKVNAGSSFKSGVKLFQIVNLDKVWIEAKIYQDELPLLDTLTQFRIKATGVDKIFDARKQLLYPNLDPKEATATLRLEIDNPDGELKPGMYTSINASAKTVTTLVIPRTAAIRKNGKWYAFLASEYEGEYEPVEIAIKPIDKINYEVISGLAEGDEVVNNSLFMMDSDAQINGLY
jgi:Cu(I)/Ag(I) efflux system membrane fusion protein